MASDAFLPVAEYRVYLCDAQSPIEPYLSIWTQIVGGRWIIRYRRLDGTETETDGPAEGSAAEMLLASRAAMRDLLAG